MPAPEVTENEIRIRVKEPSLFVQESFRYVDISKEQGIRAVMGKLKSDPEGSMVVQSYRFDKSKWTVDEAVAWVNEHKGKSAQEVINLYKEIDLTGNSERKILKYYRAKISDVDEASHTIKAVVSTEGIDRDKEINLITSWEKRLENFKSHPVLLSSHMYNSLQNQIGEATNIEINKVKRELIMDFKYYVGEGNKEADWAWNLASKKIAMFSVGYIPFKVLEGDAIPEEYRDKEPRRVYAENELLEVSQVVVGSNRGALQMGIDNPTIEQNQYLFDVVKSFGDNIPDLENKADGYKVIPFKAYKLAPEDTEWRGAQETVDATVEQLKVMSTLYSGDGENKGDYKLPHHKTDYTTVWRGVAGAMAVLFGSRGGMKPAPSESEKRGAYNHLAKHYKEFDKEVPEYRSYTDAEIKELILDFETSAPAKEAPASKSILLEPIMVKDMQEMQAFYEIYKSGRVLSDKNKTIIKDAVKILDQATQALKELLQLTEKPDNDKIEQDKSSKETEEAIKRINDLLNESKSLLNK